MKIATLNGHNLFLTPTPGEFQKDHAKTETLAKAVRTIDADILMLQEVGGADSLSIFAKEYLDDTYIPSLIKGNSDRNIELGFLIKRGLDYKFEHYTHRNRSLDFNYDYQIEENKKANKEIYPPEKFSRDIAELRVLDRDNNLKMILLQVHLKSRKDKEGIDPESNNRRGAELKTLVRVYNALTKKFNVPVLIGGDFNGEIRLKNGAPELVEILHKTDLVDTLELIKTPKEDRFTLIHFTRDKRRELIQFDYLFIPTSLHNKIKKEDSGVFHFQDDNGKPLPLPKRDYERYHMPSDHFPLYITFANI